MADATPIPESLQGMVTPVSNRTRKNASPMVSKYPTSKKKYGRQSPAGHPDARLDPSTAANMESETTTRIRSLKTSICKAWSITAADLDSHFATVTSLEFFKKLSYASFRCTFDEALPKLQAARDLRRAGGVRTRGIGKDREWSPKDTIALLHSLQTPVKNKITAKDDRNDANRASNALEVQEDKSSAHEEEQREENRAEEEEQDDKSTAEEEEQDAQSSADNSPVTTPSENVEIGLHALDNILPDGLKSMPNSFNDGMDGLKSDSHGGSDAGPGDSDDDEYPVLTPSNGVAKRRLSPVIEEGSRDAVVSSPSPSRAKRPKLLATPQMAELMSNPSGPTWLEHATQHPPPMPPAYVAEEDHQAMSHTTLDLQRLHPAQMLNDALVYGVLMLLTARTDSSSILDTCHVEARTPSYIVDSVVRHVFIPLHDQHGNHWALAIYDTTMNDMHYFNSMPRERSTNWARETLSTLFPCEEGPWWHFVERECPTQPNGYDCGVYVLIFAFYAAAERFLPRRLPIDLYRQIFSCLLDRSSTGMFVKDGDAEQEQEVFELAPQAIPLKNLAEALATHRQAIRNRVQEARQAKQEQLSHYRQLLDDLHEASAVFQLIQFKADGGGVLTHLERIKNDLYQARQQMALRPSTSMEDVDGLAAEVDKLNAVKRRWMNKEAYVVGSASGFLRVIGLMDETKRRVQEKVGQAQVHLRELTEAEANA